MDCVSLGVLVAILNRLFFVASIALCGNLQADTWISVGGGTKHACETCGYNNFNPGLGAQHDINPDLRVLGGVYRNSYYKTSIYAGLGYQPLQHGVVRFGVMGALVTNYDHLKVPAMILPAVSIEGDRLGVDILGFPSIGSYIGLITANLKFKL